MDEDDHKEPRCSTCGGDGLSSLHAHPELWGGDACSEWDYPIECPTCADEEADAQAPAARKPTRDRDLPAVVSPCA